MIGSEKLGRKISSSAKAKKPEMKKASPRNPLKDLNICTIPPSQASAETQRRGYFRFLRSSSSSKEDSIRKCKSQPRSPKSAPPNSKTLSSKTIPIPNSFHDKNPPKTIRSKKPAKPKAPDLLHRWNQQRPTSREITGGITEQDLIPQVDANEKIGSCAASTPERVIELAGLKISSGLKEGMQQFSATPRSNTPPIMASISPEVPCVSFVAPTPVCFATGHVLPGVQSRRKCRPRGILTVGEEQSSLSGVSSVRQPLAQASVCWFSSPLEFGKRSGRNASSSQVRTFDFPNEASVNWLLSPSDAVEELGTVSARANISNFDDKFGMETTPSSGNVILRTPNSNSSISPFSVIVRQAEASSRIRAHISHKEKGIYRYDNNVPDISPFYEKSWSNCVAASTPSSYTNSRRNGVISPLELDSVSEGMEAMRTLAKPVLGNDKNDILPLPSLSLKFGCTPTPLNSVKLNCFQSSRCAEPCKLETKEKTPLVSDVSISWRDGLLSRIFEMGELDSYVGLSEAEEEFDFSRDANVKSDIDFKIDLETGSSVLQEGNGFGSFEFLVKDNKFGVHKCEPKVPPLEPIALAESFSTEGGLISSGDSDWTLFYKNNLFEV